MYVQLSHIKEFDFVSTIMKCFGRLVRKELEVDQADQRFVTLEPGSLDMWADRELLQYSILHWDLSLHTFPDSPSPGVRVTLVFGRKIANQVLTTYLPTLLLLSIVHSTNFFKDFFFEAVVTVNLTALLVLTTLYLSVSGALPQTSSVKMVEVWLLATLFVPFTEVILHVYMDSLRDDEREVNQHGTVRTVTGGGSVVVASAKVGQVRPAGLEGLQAMWDEAGKQQQQQQQKEQEEKRWEGRERKLALCRSVGRTLIPLAFALFSFIYWSYGIAQIA